MDALIPRRALPAFAVLLAVLICPRIAAAQAVTGTLLGNVTDQAGLPMPGATVTITETSTNISLDMVTNDAGLYTFPSLKDGTYRVVAELAGFKKVLRDGVIVPVNTTIRVDLRMEVGALEESITVVGSSPILQTDRTDTGRIIESKMVTDMPLTFNRNFQSILITVPGSTRPHREHSAFFNSQDSLAVEVNGQPRQANNTLIEGLDNNHKTGLLQVIIPAADALETVSVSTSNYDAEFGRSGGAVTNVTLKSGTNQLKGSVFIFGNTDATNASDYFTHLKAPTKFLNSRLHPRRPDRPQQVVLLRRLSADDRQRRLRRARHGADDGDAQRRLQRGDAAHLRSVDRRSRQRQQPDAVRQQRDSAGSHQPDRAAAAAVRSRTEHRRRAARPAELPAGADAREDHRRLRRQAELQRERERPVVLPR